MQASFPWVRTLEGCIPDVGMNCTWTSSCKNCRTTWTLISPWNGIDVTQPPLLPGAWQEQMSGAGRRGSHPRPQIISANNLKCSVWCTLKKKIITTHVYLNNNSSPQKNNLEWSMENQSVENKYKEEDKRHCGIPSRQPPSNPPEIYTLKKITPDCTRVGLCDRILWKKWYATFETGSWGTQQLLFWAYSPSHHSLWGTLTAMSWRLSGSPVDHKK